MGSEKIDLCETFFKCKGIPGEIFSAYVFNLWPEYFGAPKKEDSDY